MKKKILLLMITLIPVSMVGCTKKEESFESKVIRKFTYVDSANNELKAQVEDIKSQIAMLKQEMGISDTSRFTDKDIKFSSIKILAPNVTTTEGEIVIPANSEFNISADIMNTTEENLSQLTLQVYMTYNLNGNYYDRHLVDTRFDVLPKTVRKQIEFKNIPVKGADMEHKLTFAIKDVNGNVISTFEKTIHVK